MPRRFTADQRSAYVEEFEGSGLTQQAFADQHGLNLHTLRGWLYKGIHRSESGAGPVGLDPVRFLEVVPTEAPPDEKAGGAALVLRVGELVDLELTELPPAAWLAKLVLALEC